MAGKDNTKILALIVTLVVAVILYGILTMPDRRSTSERIGDAVEALPEGVDNAAEQLERRTPGERLGDAVEDAGENLGNEIRENTNNE